MIDKVKASPYETYVLAFATAVFQSATLPECEQKTRIVTTLVEAAVRRYKFQDAVSKQDYVFRHYGPEDQQPHKCVKKCIELHCESFIPIVVDLLAGCTTDLSPPDTQACAEKLMAPLLQLWTKDATITQHAAQSLENLRTVTLRLLVDSMAANPVQNLDQARLERVLQIAIVDGRMDLLISMYVPFSLHSQFSLCLYYLQRVVLRLQAVSVAAISLRPVLDKLKLAEFGVDAEELRRILESISTGQQAERDGQSGATRMAAQRVSEDGPVTKKRKLAPE